MNGRDREPQPETIITMSSFSPVDPDRERDQRQVGAALLKMIADGFTVRVRGGIIRTGAVSVVLEGERANPLYAGPGEVAEVDHEVLRVRVARIIAQRTMPKPLNYCLKSEQDCCFVAADESIAAIERATALAKAEGRST